MKKFFSLLLVLVLAFTVVGCGSKEPETVKATKVTIVAKRTRVQIGHTLQFSYTVNPSNAEDVTSVKWSVSDTNYGTIDDSGLFTAKENAGVCKVIVETNTGLTANKAVQITTEEVNEYPDLGEYTIKIAQATVALGEIDPFLGEDTAEQYGYYSGSDREARQKAWTDVEEDFNCHIEVVEYPSDAAWGPSRWSYIETQARLDSPQYDFYIIPDAQIPGFVSANAILDLTDWYNTYGKDSMNAMSKTAGSYKGRLYSINTADAAIYNMLGYNVGLWEIINDYDPTIIEPAAAFNQGLWTYSYFIEYCKKCQNALNSIYGTDSSYYALSGWPTYYWVGMVDRNGTGVADVTNLKMHLTGEDETAAGEALREIYAYGAFDPAFSVDGGVVTWTNGTALFNTGDLWFIGSNQDRWKSDMWGEGDATRYGYVPFAAPDDSDPDHAYVGVTSEACWAMAARRDFAYKGYGEDCTAENIYWAIMEYWTRADSYYKAEDDYDAEAESQRRAAKYFATEESQKAFINVSNGLEVDGFYDPLTSNSNTVVATYASSFDIAIRAYTKGESYSTWAEAVGTFQDELDKSILNAFG